MPQISFARCLLLLSILVVVFFAQLGAARLWDRDEPRNSRASHEMLARGDWIVPTFNDELRDHKPILLYWGQMASYATLGESEFTARLPSALCAVLTVLSVAILATCLSCGRGINQEGFWAAGAVATCLLFVMAGRAATPDACLIAFSTLGITALVVASLRPALPFSSGAVGSAKWIPALFGYTMLGLAVLAKGPVGLVLPLAVVHLWWLICDRLQSQSVSEKASAEPSSRRFGSLYLSRLLVEVWQTLNPLRCIRSLFALRTFPGLLVCALAAVPWYFAVGVETNGAFLRGFFLDHNVGRAMSSMEGHNGSIFFYPVAFLCGTFPWSLWLIPILMWARKASQESVVQRQKVILAATWVSIYVLAFSVASTKLPSYITPCYAGAALVVGGYFRAFETTWSLPSLNWRRTAYVLTIFLGVGIAAGLLWYARHESMPRLQLAATCGIIIAAMGGAGFIFEATGRTAWVPTAWLVGAAAFHSILFGQGARIVDSYRNDLDLVTQASELQTGQPWLCIGGMEPSWVHYLGHPIVEIREHPRESNSWSQVAEFLYENPDGYIIVSGEAALQAMPANMTGHLELQTVSKADRFLKSGEIAIFQSRYPTQIAAVRDQIQPSRINSIYR